MQHNITISITTEELHYLNTIAEEAGRSLEEVASRIVGSRALSEKPGYNRECAKRVAAMYKDK